MNRPLRMVATAPLRRETAVNGPLRMVASLRCGRGLR